MRQQTEAASDLVVGGFGRRGSRGQRIAAAIAAVLGLLAIGGLVYRSGPRGTPAPPAGGHQHGAALAADSAAPVTLSDNDRRRIGVTFARVERLPLSETVRTVAQVTYDETRVREVVTRVDGYVERLFVDATGQPVAAGQPLFAIYAPMVVTTEQELLLAQRLSRQVEAGSADAREGAAALLESARTRLLNWDIPAATVARVLESGAVERTVTLRAPASGVVIQKSVLAGQRLMAGEVAYRIADLGRVWIEGEVFEPDVSTARAGLPVRAEFPALPGETWSGRIDYVYPTFNPETRTARIRVALANPGLRLKPGMYATIEFAAATPPALSVPRSAVLMTGKRALVFVEATGGSLAPREVVTGRSTADRIEIRSGLVEGERVVASATFLVDAESNLGSALGGMGGMPGMDVTTPPTRGRPDSAPAPAPAGAMPDMPDMPGMDHSAHDSAGH